MFRGGVLQQVQGQGQGLLQGFQFWERDVAFEPHFIYSPPKYYNIILTITYLQYIQYTIYNKMFNYHIIHSQPANTTTAEYNHFLTLGSYQTIINLDPLLSFSTINLLKGTKLHINQQKIEQGCFNVVVCLDRHVRVNGSVCSMGDIVGNVMDVDQNVVGEGQAIQENKRNAQILYILIRGNSTLKNTKLSNEPLSLTPSLSLTHIKLPKDQQLSLNKRIFTYIKQGKLKIQQTGQQVPEGQSIYTKKGCGQLIACEDSELYQIEFDSQK